MDKTAVAKKPGNPTEETKAKQERIIKCTEMINKTLDQYGCTLSSYFIITSKGNIPKIEVISK